MGIDYAELNGRSPHGERGLKSVGATQGNAHLGRSPHGERGLKSQSLPPARYLSRSLPSRGAWIEINNF